MKRTLKSPKSRGGCQRCKEKHVKCDETKPQCRVCQANHVVCPGYIQQIRWSSKHEVYDTSAPRKQPRISEDTTFGLPSSTNPSSANNVVYQTPPEEDIRPTATAAHVSDMSMPNGPSNGVVDMAEWPDVDLSGYEDFGFELPLPDPSIDVSDETGPFDHFKYPFEDLIPNLANSPDEASQPDRTTDLAPKAVDSNDVERKMKQVPSRSSGSTGLLQTFYRLSQPDRIPGFSDDDLVSYYFNNICTIYSCFDSELNSFRTLAADSWPKSKTVHLAIQFMSLAHLANWYPYLNALGLGKRSEAWTALQKDLQGLQRSSKSVEVDGVMLSLLLLGPTAAWNQANNLGLQYLLIARNLLQAQLQAKDGRSPHNEFFQSAMMYWEMLASFVDPVPLAPLSGLKAPELVLPEPEKPMTPHPWTGVMDDVCFLIAEIGRVLRRQRCAQTGLALKRRGLDLPSEIDEAWTRTLEGLLLNMSVPTADEIVDYEDPRTPRSDLSKLADAYRYMGLLEIYGAFPALLRETLSSIDTPSAIQIITPVGTGVYADEIYKWLVAIAIHIMDLIKSVAITSAACRLLPLLLMATSSQLRLPSPTGAGASPPGHNEVIDARYLVEARMLVLSRKYAQKPVLQMVDIVKETWERLDSGSNRAHWMDVSQEKSWQTIFG